MRLSKSNIQGIKIPFTAILSPRWASVRISSQSEIVSEVPPPPLAEVSRGSRAVTAGDEASVLGRIAGEYQDLTSDRFNKTCKHSCGC